MSLSALKPVKSRIMNSIKRIINELNVNNLLLELISGYFNNLLKPIRNAFLYRGMILIQSRNGPL